MFLSSNALNQGPRQEVPWIQMLSLLNYMLTLFF